MIVSPVLQTWYKLFVMFSWKALISPSSGSSTMLSSLFCACASLALIQAAVLPEGLRYIGVGYNLLRGNPDGNFWAAGGDDPGLLSTRKVLTLSADAVPSEIVYEFHDTCRPSNEFSLFYDPQSYQNKLLESVTSSGTFRSFPIVLK